MTHHKKSKTELLAHPNLLACTSSSLTLSWKGGAKDAVEYGLRWSRQEDGASFVSIRRDNPLSTIHKMEGLTAGVGYVFQVRPLFGNGGSNGWGWSAVSLPFTPMDSSDSTPGSPAAGHQSFPSSSSAQQSRIPLFPANNWQPFYRMRNEGKNDDPLTLSLADVLSEDAAESRQPAPRIEEIFLFNMIVSTSRAEKLRSWLGARWGTHIGRVSIRVFCDKSDAGPKREGAFSSHARLSVTPVDVSDSTGAAELFGHHHSKLCVVLYSTGVRLAVLTSNLRAAELDFMTNAMWVQDFPLKGAGGEGECEFEKDLCDYLSHIHVQGAEKDGARGKADKKDKKDKGSKKDKEDQRERESREARRAEADVDREPHPDQTPLIALIAALRRHDFSSAQVVLIPSVPSRHTSRHSSEHAHTASAHASASASAAPYCMESQGHVKLRAVLKKEARAPVGLGAAATLDLQCSSLGAQGKGDAFLNEVTSSMHADRSAFIPLGAHGDLGRVNLLWPSVDTVRLSQGGFSSGDSIMAEAKVFEGEGVRKCLRNWVPAAAADKIFAPHIKTYYRHFVAADGQVELMWMYLGSHNLSQASWVTSRRPTCSCT